MLTFIFCGDRFLDSQIDMQGIQKCVRVETIIIIEERVVLNTPKVQNH
jgi:hypothetical protein